MSLAGENILENSCPRLLIGANIVKRRSINFHMNRRFRRTIKHNVKHYVFADGMRKKQTGNYALINYVQPASIMKINKT